MMNNSRKQNLEIEKRKRETSLKRYERINRRRKLMLVGSAVAAIIYAIPLFILFPGRVWVIPILISWIAIYSYVMFRMLNGWLGRLSQDALCYASVSAAEQLEEGDPVKASIWVDKLLGALPYFLKHKSVKIDPWGFSAKLTDLLYVHSERLPRKAMLSAIQDSGSEIHEFSQHFYSFAEGLSSENEKDNYIVTQNFLSWLINKSEKYKLKPMGLWERHPGLKDILPILGMIIVLVLQIVLGL